MTGWLDGTAFAAIPGAVAGGLIAGTLLPLLGMWVVLQRVVFLGVTLAQVAAAGVALGLILNLPSLPFGMAVTLGLVTLVGSRQRLTRLGDAALGAGFCVASALSLLFISRSASDLDEVNHVLYGNLIYAAPEAVWTVGITLAACATIIVIFFKELLFTSFDAESAAALGMRARGWQLLLFLVLALALSVSMRTTGSLLSFAMLVLPPLAALRLRVGLRTTFTLSAVLGFLGTLAGLALAVSADLHVESSITIALFMMIPICAAWRRHPAWGLALAGALFAAGASITPTDSGDAHRHHHDAAIVAAAGDPFHADVALLATQPLAGGPLRIEWSIDIHRDPEETQVPPAVWLLLSSEGLFDEHLLVPDLYALPAGDSLHTGTYLVDVDRPIHHIDGQLWSGPSDSMDSEPLDPAHTSVESCDVTRR
ncbi:MAG: iron chelate uptake ABC transporter family permease subunit [Planctomycetota bacterium]|nr:iron chelate uptake ABC transporter family permease subunit [Planctomycetota bacterium]